MESSYFIPNTFSVISFFYVGSTSLSIYPTLRAYDITYMEIEHENMKFGQELTSIKLYSQCLQKCLLHIFFGTLT
ncbi:CLUMA_CG015976, isoform A [Clunio marinus]|uniref:CLUMA_CG015976, isoform A n=1 Tax=Clunio marinus TaxID=568069 RepID=A0A1J1IRT4_9DIPT|nr:CLUMA_CG015976, isoform A [Clunio marinus]